MNQPATLPLGTNTVARQLGIDRREVGRTMSRYGFTPVGQAPPCRGGSQSLWAAADVATAAQRLAESTRGRPRQLWQVSVQAPYKVFDEVLSNLMGSDDHPENIDDGRWRFVASRSAAIDVAQALRVRGYAAVASPAVTRG